MQWSDRYPVAHHRVVTLDFPHGWRHHFAIVSILPSAIITTDTKKTRPPSRVFYCLKKSIHCSQGSPWEGLDTDKPASAVLRENTGSPRTLAVHAPGWRETGLRDRCKGASTQRRSSADRRGKTLTPISGLGLRGAFRDSQNLQRSVPSNFGDAA